MTPFEGDRESDLNAVEPAAPVVVEIIASHTEEVEEPPVAPEPKSARKRRPRRQRTPAPAPAPAKRAQARRRAARRAAPAPVAAVSGQRFTIEYQAERVIRATSVQDALRQATAMGAVEVIGITRED